MTESLNTTTDTTWNLADLADDDFETFAAWAANKAAAFEADHAAELKGESKPRRHTARDALGRFVKVVHIDVVEVWVNDSNGVSHAHTGCGTKKGTTATTSSTPTGWVCTNCVAVTVSAFTASHDVAGVSGHKDCDTCNTTRKVRSFPTVVDSGWRVRGTTCRKCQKAARVGVAA